MELIGIVPFAAKRSVVKLDQKKAGKKRERWQAIAKGAAEQSKRGIVPASAGCDELSGSDELRERAGCSACSL